MEFHHDVIPKNVASLIVSVYIVKKGCDTFFGRARLHLDDDFNNERRSQSIRLLEPDNVKAEIVAAFYRTGPKRSMSRLKDELPNAKWLPLLFLGTGDASACRDGEQVIPAREEVLAKLKDIAFVSASGASASDHEHGGRLWLTSRRMLFLPDEVFESRVSQPPFPMPMQISLGGIMKVTVEKDFEYCPFIDPNAEPDDSSVQRSGRRGYSRMRVWGKLPFFFEIRGCGEKALTTFRLIEKEMMWRCKEARFSNLTSPYQAWRRVPRWSTCALGAEMERLGAIASEKWRMTASNTDFKLCRSYSLQLVVPASISDVDAFDARLCREHERIPILTWYDQRTGAALCRSAQPIKAVLKSGEYQPSLLAGRLATHDARSTDAHNRYMDALEKSCHGKLWIADLRPIADALYNACLKGNRGGWESGATFQHIWPTQMVQRAFHDIRPYATARNPKGPLWQPLSEQTGAFEGFTWVAQVSLLLRVTNRIASRLSTGTSVLVHCSGGWDRTAQICGLVQVVSDPYYRTIEGFKTLIQKDWLAFGHKFAERNHFVPGKEHRHCAPIFVQFLDAVWQMLQQRPTAFEFNEALLLFLATQTYSRWFGDFVHDNDFERARASVYEKTCSLWSHVLHRRHVYSNPLFSATTSSLSHQMRRPWKVIWRGGLNVRTAPTMSAPVVRRLVFGDTVEAAKDFFDSFADAESNEWIRLKCGDSAVQKTNASSAGASKNDQSTGKAEQWVCVKDAQGQLLHNGRLKIKPDKTDLWRALFLRWHPRSLAAHPTVRCMLRSPEPSPLIEPKEKTERVYLD